MSDTFNENDADQAIREVGNRLEIAKLESIIKKYDAEVSRILSKIGEPCNRDNNGRATY